MVVIQIPLPDGLTDDIVQTIDSLLVNAGVLNKDSQELAITVDCIDDYQDRSVFKQ
jgi:hypothetical protein